MNKVRLFLAVVAFLLVDGCGSRSPAAQAGALGIGPIDTTNTVGTLGTIVQGTANPVCLGPICVGQVDTLSLGPVQLTGLPSLPLGPTPPPPPPPPPPPGCSSYTLGMQVLVISANGQEADLPAIQQALGYHSVPYTTWVGTQQPGQLTPDKLATGCAGNYQGVILTTGGLAYSPDGGTTWLSGLTSAEWQALRGYEQTFHVREISWYVFPGADQGLNPPTAGIDTTATPVNGTLTAAGQAVFPYVNTSNPVTISKAWCYLATPADSSVTPLLVDAAGDALVSTRLNADGRETMALTFDSNPYLLHDLELAHGLVEWVTRSIYLGEYRAYNTPQVDDLLIDDDMYTGGVYRMNGADFTATQAWQTGTQTNLAGTGAGSHFRLAFAFNGVGGSDTDDLTLSARLLNGNYLFINHTFDHENLDAVSYDTAYDELAKNIAFAQSQGWQNFYTANFVGPDVSGLTNPAAMQAAVDNGIQYMVSDTSRAGWNNPAPNIGIYSTIEPSILIVPRRPTNLFYNVSTPSDWTAEYNAIYHSYWGRDLTYAEILDNQSDVLLIYMLQGDLDPQMYHQPNLRAYDGVHTLLGDLLDLAFQKYRRYSTLPIVSPDMQVAGQRMGNTMARNASGLTATLTPGVSVSFTSPVDVQFALSGVCTAGSERYAGKCISTVSVAAGQTVTLPVQ